MSSSSSLLHTLTDRTKLPQPSLQKLAIISIFNTLRYSPSKPDRTTLSVISQCLNSKSPPVVDQSVRELCLLVKHSRSDASQALFELQSALEGSDPRLVNVFVKALGFVIQFVFRDDDATSFRCQSSGSHPFVKIAFQLIVN